MLNQVKENLIKILTARYNCVYNSDTRADFRIHCCIESDARTAVDFNNMRSDLEDRVAYLEELGCE